MALPRRPLPVVTSLPPSSPSPSLSPLPVVPRALLAGGERWLCHAGSHAVGIGQGDRFGPWVETGVVVDATATRDGAAIGADVDIERTLVFGLAFEALPEDLSLLPAALIPLRIRALQDAAWREAHWTQAWLEVAGAPTVFRAVVGRDGHWGAYVPVPERGVHLYVHSRGVPRDRVRVEWRLDADPDRVTAALPAPSLEGLSPPAPA